MRTTNTQRQDDLEMGGCCLITLFAAPFLIALSLLGVAIKLAFIAACIVAVLWGIEALGADLTWFEFNGLQNPFRF